MAEASLRYVIVHGEARFSRTECICGQNSRSEYRNGPFLVGGDPKRPETMQLEFGPRRALIHNRDLGYRFDIDLESRVYTAFALRMRLGWRNFKYKLGIGDEHVFATDDADSADLNPFSCGSLFGPRTDPAAGDIRRYAPTSAPSCSRPRLFLLRFSVYERPVPP